ncbi:MAG: ABC transporter permease [Oscillospiraceae bacterium]|jgi:simple sugar transport system permease protein|nr:ABC transporter permease [Oscillospiraceae bacterium]
MDMFYFIVQQSMVFMIPLMIVALGGMFSERSGIVNIALEGKMVMGAFVGVLFLNIFQNPENVSDQGILLLALLVAMLTGMLMALLHAFASINLKANQIISGIAINMFAPAFAIYTAVFYLDGQFVPFINQFRIASVPILGNIPVLGPMLFQRTYITTYLGFLILVISAIVLYKTKFGLRLRACGEYPQAADSVGVSVAKIRYAGVLISGALAGMGGLIWIVPISSRFGGSVAGYGFLALAVLIFGAWKPMRILFASFFFGILQTIANSFTAIPFLLNLGIPSAFYNMAPYIATLLLLAFTSKNTQAPKAVGQPYDKGMR